MREVQTYLEQNKIELPPMHPELAASLGTVIIEAFNKFAEELFGQFQQGGAIPTTPDEIIGGEA